MTLYAAEMTIAQKMSASNVALTPSEVSADSFATTFAARDDIEGYTMAENVLGVMITLAEPKADEPSYRMVEIQLELNGPAGAGSQMEFVTAYVRAPDVDIDFQN